MNETIQKMDDKTLWALLSDIAALMKVQGYNLEVGNKELLNNAAFMFWYDTWRLITNEIDRRMNIDYEG